jgi:N-acetylmuramoyl-L-alanine amidase
MKQLTLWLFLSICLPTSLFAAKLQAIEMKQQAGKTSLYFNLDTSVVHKVFTLTNPDRVVVDLENTTLACNVAKLHLNNRLIKGVRTGHPNPKTLRLVFEVTNVVMLRANLKNSASSRQPAFSLDLSANPIPKISYAKPLIKPKAILQSKSPQSLRNIVIALDPGHGGKDPGARGPKSSLEKNITLAIAVKLQQLINKQPGMRAVLTRPGDSYVALRERLKIARKHNADVFISIHADAFINQQSSGVSVFALSQRGATSEAARWLAEKENYSELGGVNLRGLDDQSGLVRTVLIDLSQTATIGASLHMGEGVLKSLNKMTNLHNHRVEQARFMVLKSPDIPSILIETGFISNPREERNLTSAAYQLQLTQSIFQGIKNYFWEYPPHGTRIEALVNNKMHRVLPGESLQSIASHYHVSVANLQKLNHLSSTRVISGQKLVLPSGLL